MIDLFGTPYSDKLHVVERYRLVDYAEAKDAMARGMKENRRGGGPYKADYGRFHYRGSGRLHHALEGGDDLSARP
jgi:hypothetical protein